MKEFNGIDQIDSMERSIVANLCDPGADDEDDQEDQNEQESTNLFKEDELNVDLEVWTRGDE